MPDSVSPAMATLAWNPHGLRSSVTTYCTQDPSPGNSSEEGESACVMLSPKKTVGTR